VPLESLDLHLAPEHDERFYPAGVNVEFYVPVGDLHVRMRVHERGSGETLSCGTGAVAVAAVALAAAGRDAGTVTVDVPGGRLTVTLDGAECHLAGPAVIVASGELSL
jgi:diaminopimelate epimerase